MHMKRVSEAKTLHDCAQRCHESAAPVPNKRANAATAQRLQTEQQVREYVAKLHAAKNKPNGPCNMWQWADRNGCFHSAKKMMASTCYENPRWKGGSRRHDVWDAVDTSRQVGERRLMTFGCSMAVRGDGSYSDRIPQWLEFQLINFPTAHFFVYLRGSDGYGSFDPYLSGGMPGVVGGVAVLYPYILAGVVTVIWLPRDGANLLNRYMDSCVGCVCVMSLRMSLRTSLPPPAGCRNKETVLCLPVLCCRVGVYCCGGSAVARCLLGLIFTATKSATKTTFCIAHGTLASGFLPASTMTNSSPRRIPQRQQSCGGTATAALPCSTPRLPLM